MANYLKRTVFILLINISLAVNITAQDIPNGDFEDWTFFTIDTSVICPHYWDADFHVAPIKSTDAHSGQFALKVTIAYLNPIFNSRVVLDSDTILDNYYLGEGIFFPYKPSNLRYWIKYDAKGNDSVCVELALKKWDNINNQSVLIGGLESCFNGASNQYTEVIEAITYHSTLNPDSLFVTIYTNGTDTTTYGIIDDMHLEYGGVLGMDDYFSKSRFIIAPNPTTNHLNINTTIPQNQPIHYQIINTLGEAVMRGSSNENAFSADVSTLPSGVYFISLKSESGSGVKRFVRE